jgi:hypothetical protein
MLSWKVFGSGLSGLTSEAMCKDVGAALTATGTTQGTALELSNADNEVTTVASGSGVVLSSDISSGDTQTVFNAGANALKVYPPSGMGINALSANAAMTLATNTGCLFKCVSTTRIFGVLSA